jgi:hypothetical protein
MYNNIATVPSTFEDGGTGYVAASPVPEPRTTPVLLLVSLGIFFAKYAGHSLRPGHATVAPNRDIIG